MNINNSIIKKTNQATENDKIKQIKYFLMQELGKDNGFNKLPLDDIEKWKDKIKIIKNYNYLQDIKFKLNNSADNKLNHKSY